jgi:DNA modification methylase
MTVDIRVGDCLDILRTLDAESVQCVVTSPPYWGLRDYGVAGQLGLEKTPGEYVERMVDVFREVRRALKPDGVLWLNVGDSFATGGGAVGRCPGGGEQGARFLRQGHINTQPNRMPLPGLKPKDLIGIPWRIAFALQADGWWLRSDIVWAKPNGMPESVRDRPTRSHEMVFLLSKSERYFYDADAARTPAAPATETRLAQNVDAQEGSSRANGGRKTNGKMKAVGAHGSTLEGAPHGRHALGENIPEKERRSDKQRGHGRVHAGFNARWDAMEKAEQMEGGSNLRSVWWLAPAQFREGHFATMPPALAEICIVAGSRVGDTVLDPFGGAGTTGLVADRLSRNALLIELNPSYAAMARERITNDNPLFNPVVA